MLRAIDGIILDLVKSRFSRFHVVHNALVTDQSLKSRGEFGVILGLLSGVLGAVSGPELILGPARVGVLGCKPNEKVRFLHSGSQNILGTL